MKTKNLILLTFIFLYSCNCEKELKVDLNKNAIHGTWKLFYGSIEQNDSLTVKDVSKSDFIKIINNSHFAFFNQVKGSSESFYGGAGTYSLDGNTYIETLDFIGSLDVRGHVFPFTIEISGDTLIQRGLEEVKEANIKRYIVEKYVRVKD